MLNTDFNKANKIENKQLGYSVPENYFTELEQKINKQLPDNNDLQNKANAPTRIFSLKQHKLLWSAATAIVLLVGFFWLPKSATPALDQDLVDLNYLFEENFDTEADTEFTLLDMYLEEEELSISDIDLQQIWFENDLED